MWQEGSDGILLPVPVRPRLLTLRERIQQEQNYRLRLNFDTGDGVVVPSEGVTFYAHVDPISPPLKQRDASLRLLG